MNQKVFNKTYESLGFIEALLAIMIAGIVAIALLGMAAKTMSQVVLNERSDEQTQIAIEAGAMIRSIADTNKTSVEPAFPAITGNIGNCYKLSDVGGLPSFDKIGTAFKVVCRYDSGQRNACKSATVSEYEGLFRVFCITSASDAATEVVVGKVIVGEIKCESEATCDLADYEYFVLVKTPQR